MSVADLGEWGRGGGGGKKEVRCMVKPSGEKKRLISLHKIKLYTNFIFIFFSRMSHNFDPVSGLRLINKNPIPHRPGKSRILAAQF